MTMKKIVLEALVTDADIVLFRIVEQTHRGTSFGGSGSDSYCMPGISMHSDTRPAIGSSGIFYVRGDCYTDDHTILKCSKKKWNEICGVVTSYNLFFKENAKQNDKRDGASAFGEIVRIE